MADEAAAAAAARPESVGAIASSHLGFTETRQEVCGHAEGTRLLPQAAPHRNHGRIYANMGQLPAADITAFASSFNVHTRPSDTERQQSNTRLHKATAFGKGFLTPEARLAVKTRQTVADGMQLRGTMRGNKTGFHKTIDIARLLYIVLRTPPAQIAVSGMGGPGLALFNELLAPSQFQGQVIVPAGKGASFEKGWSAACTMALRAMGAFKSGATGEARLSGIKLASAQSTHRALIREAFDLRKLPDDYFADAANHTLVGILCLKCFLLECETEQNELCELLYVACAQVTEMYSLAAAKRYLLAHWLLRIQSTLRTHAEQTQHHRPLFVASSQSPLAALCAGSGEVSQTLDNIMRDTVPKDHLSTLGSASKGRSGR